MLPHLDRQTVPRPAATPAPPPPRILCTSCPINGFFACQGCTGGGRDQSGDRGLGVMEATAGGLVTAVLGPPGCEWGEFARLECLEDIDHLGGRLGGGGGVRAGRCTWKNASRVEGGGGRPFVIRPPPGSVVRTFGMSGGSRTSGTRKRIPCRISSRSPRGENREFGRRRSRWTGVRMSGGDSQRRAMTYIRAHDSGSVHRTGSEAGEWASGVFPWGIPWGVAAAADCGPPSSGTSKSGKYCCCKLPKSNCRTMASYFCCSCFNQSSRCFTSCASCFCCTCWMI